MYSTARKRHERCQELAHLLMFRIALKRKFRTQAKLYTYGTRVGKNQLWGSKISPFTWLSRSFSY